MAFLVKAKEGLWWIFCEICQPSVNQNIREPRPTDAFKTSRKKLLRISCKNLPVSVTMSSSITFY